MHRHNFKDDFNAIEFYEHLKWNVTFCNTNTESAGPTIATLRSNQAIYTTLDISNDCTFVQRKRENQKEKNEPPFFMHILNLLVPLGRLENEKRCNLIILCWFCMKTTFYNQAIAFSKWKNRNKISVSIPYMRGGKEWMHVEKERNDGDDTWKN